MGSGSIWDRRSVVGPRLCKPQTRVRVPPAPLSGSIPARALRDRSGVWFSDNRIPSYNNPRLRAPPSARKAGLGSPTPSRAERGPVWRMRSGWSRRRSGKPEVPQGARVRLPHPPPSSCWVESGGRTSGCGPLTCGFDSHHPTHYMPLWPTWSRRPAEARTIVVRFHWAAPSYGSVAQLDESTRLLSVEVEGSTPSGPTILPA